MLGILLCVSALAQTSVTVDANGNVLNGKPTNFPTGKLKVNNVAVVGGGGSGSVATDSIFDAKGDLPVGSGADTSLKLSVGTNGYVLTPDSTTSTGLKWTQRITSSNEPLGAQLYDNAGTPKLAIDFNTRRAYGTNGTDINIDWVSRILSGNWQARDVFQVSNVNDNAVFTADIGNQNNDDDNIQFYGINASGDPVFKIDGHGTLTLSDDDAVGHAVFIDVATITAARTQHWRNKSGTYAMMDDYQMSITGDSVGFKLVGDSASPGNTMLYGTNGSGVKGWYAQPSGGGGGSMASDTLWDALGDLAYGSGADTGAKLAGNTTTTKKFLRQTGNGTISAAPAWDTVTNTDVGLGSVTNDAQTKAGIVPNTAPGAGQLLAGNAGGTAYAPVTLSGSGATATLSSAGVLTLSAISNATLSNSAITIAGTSTALGGSIALDTITGVGSNGFIKRTAANTYTNASSIDLSSADASGILAAARFPALTGAITTSAGAVATSLGSFTLAQLNTALSDADVARTDAANTFTGIQAFTQITLGTSGNLFGGTNMIEQRNGTNAQTFNLYNTYTDASNYERGYMSWASNTLTIGTQKAGTGTNRNLTISSAGSTLQFVAGLTNVWKMDGNTGSLLANSDNAWDIGAIGATRPRTGYFGTSLIAPKIQGGTVSGTNIAASDLTITPGVSTGSATPANIILQTTAAGGSGSTAQTLTTVGELYASGGLFLGTSPSDPGANNLTVKGIANAADHTIGVNASYSANVVFEGDSLSNQLTDAAGTPNGYNNYMGVAGADGVSAVPAIGTVNGVAVSPAVGQNVSVNGTTIVNLYETPARINALFRQEAAVNVAVILAGSNDIHSIGGYRTAEQTYSELEAYCKHLRQNGWRVIVVGELAKGGTQTGGSNLVEDVAFSQVNTYIRQNWASFADRFVDWAVVGGGTNEFRPNQIYSTRTVNDGVTTNASATVTSATAAFVSGDVGRKISGTNIPANSYIGVVNSGTSIGLSSQSTSNVPVNATASGSSISITIAAYNYLNPTYYSSDQVHQTYAGGRKLASYVQPYINDLLTYYYQRQTNQLYVNTNNTTNNNLFNNGALTLENDDASAGQTQLNFAFNKVLKESFRAGSGGDLNLGATGYIAAYVGSTGPDAYGTNGSDGPPLRFIIGSYSAFFDTAAAEIARFTPNKGFVVGSTTDPGAGVIYANKAYRTTAVTFANAVASPAEGTIQAFTDSNTATWGATIAGGGSNHVLGYFDGTNWTVTGK